MAYGGEDQTPQGVMVYDGEDQTPQGVMAMMVRTGHHLV